MKAFVWAIVFFSIVACNPAKVESFRLRPSIGTATRAELLFQGVGATMRPGHQIEFFENGTVFDAIVTEIGKAESSINMISYIWKAGAASDKVTGAIVAKKTKEKNITCRILVDSFGSPSAVPDLDPLKAAGCDVRIFRPVPGVDALARNHRKMLIIDGKSAVTGGFGVRDNWLGDGLSKDHWRDSNVRIAGPAVREMQLAYAANWLEAGGAPLAAADFAPIEPVGALNAAFVPSSGAAVGTSADRLTQLTILTAKKRVWITNAYFVPSGAIYDLLRERARTGIDVRIITAGPKSDSKPSFMIQQVEYGKLAADGVKIWEYSPAMVHSKTMLIDDELVMVGSVNLDPLSLNKLEEGAVVVEDQGLAMQLEALFFGKV